MIIIAAMSEDGVIGAGDGMPWNVPAEYRQFLDYIRGETVIMGRRSFEIFGSDLTSARNLVVSRSVAAVENAEVVPSFEAAVRRGKELGGTLYCAGGASIYRAAIPVAERMYLSYIRGDYSGDVRFPEFDRADWQIARREAHPEFRFVEYRRIRPSR